MTFRYNINCSLSNLKGARDFVRKSLTGQSISEVELGAIILAVDEMCSNLMIHAHHCNPNDSIELKIETSDSNNIVFEIIDNASIFDINKFNEPALENLVHEKRKGGLGIRLVKSIMDQVEYLKKDGKNVCRMIKKIA